MFVYTLRIAASYGECWLSKQLNLTRRTITFRSISLFKMQKRFPPVDHFSLDDGV
jgi:hypothetical protein